MDNYTVYKHVSPSNKVYIGITSQPVKKRWHGGANYTSNPYFTNAIQKYGWDGFQHIIIAEGLSEEEARIAERKLIKRYKSTDRAFGYNLCPGGEISPMKDPNVRKKSSESHKGKKSPEYTRQRLLESRVGIPLTEEHKANISGEIKKLWGDPEYRKRNLEGQQRFWKPVVAFDRDGNYIASYPSIKDADAATGVDFRNIQACCKGRKKTAGGYIWKYDSLAS